MRFVRRFLWPLVVLTLVGIAACATDTELNPQPLPPGSSSGGERSDNESEAPGSSGANAGMDAAAQPPPGPDGGDAGDAGIGDSGHGDGGDGG